MSFMWRDKSSFDGGPAESSNHVDLGRFHWSSGSKPDSIELDGLAYAQRERYLTVRTIVLHVDVVNRNLSSPMCTGLPFLQTHRILRYIFRCGRFLRGLVETRVHYCLAGSAEPP